MYVFRLLLWFLWLYFFIIIFIIAVIVVIIFIIISISIIINYIVLLHLLFPHRKLVQFGLMKGLLRRMQKYPMAVPGEPVTARIQPLLPWLDGRHNFDQISCETGEELSSTNIHFLTFLLTVCWDE